MPNNCYTWTSDADGTVKHHVHWGLAIEALIEAAPLIILREGKNKKSLDDLYQIQAQGKEVSVSHTIGFSELKVFPFVEKKRYD